MEAIKGSDLLRMIELVNLLQMMVDDDPAVRAYALERSLELEKPSPKELA